MKNLSVIILIWGYGLQSWGQNLDIALAAKQEIAPSISYQKLYGIGSSRKLNIGWGLRINSFFSGKKSYLTAPALLTSGKQSIAAFFTEYNPAKIDTLDMNRSSLFSFNSMIIIQYNFKKSAIGFNIDAFGFTLGGKQSGIFNAFESRTLHKTSQNASPTPFNVLLISDSDIGSLNSELYFSQNLKKQNALRIGLSFQFLEYTTAKVLTFDNDRFRYKTLMPFVAYSINLKK